MVGSLKAQVGGREVISGNASSNTGEKARAQLIVLMGHNKKWREPEGARHQDDSSCVLEFDPGGHLDGPRPAEIGGWMAAA